MSVRAKTGAARTLSEGDGRVYDRMGFLIEPEDVPVYMHALPGLEHRERLFAAKWTAFVTKHIDSTEQTFPDRDTLLAMPEFRNLVFKGIADKYRPKVCSSLYLSHKALCKEQTSTKTHVFHFHFLFNNSYG